MLMSATMLRMARALSCGICVTDLHTLFAITARTMPTTRGLLWIPILYASWTRYRGRLVYLTILIYHARRITGLVKVLSTAESGNYDARTDWLYGRP